jgi:hypothetical protein
MLKRAFQRELARRPTTLQRLLLERAVTLSIKAEVASADPDMPANDVVRLDGAARRARAEMFASFRDDRPKPTLFMAGVR